MNYGAEPADQVVRYTLEGTEFALKISGTAAKNFAVFALAVLRDQKKTHGKTKLVRLLREGKPLKFFSVPTDQMRDFSKAAKWGGELRKHFSKERCSQTAMPFFAVFELYFGLFLSPVQNQMHR